MSQQNTITVIPPRYVFGITESLPLKGFPAGRCRVQMRGGDWARVFVKTEIGIREFIPAVEDGAWVPGHEMITNETNQ